MVIKKSYINYIIQCYKNFPELLEMIPEDKINQLLNKNISTIKRCKVNQKYSGNYKSIIKKIRIASENELDIDKIKSDDLLTKIAVHEATHGLFSKFISTGCRKFTFLGYMKKIKLKYLDENVKYKGPAILKGMILEPNMLGVRT